MINDDSWTHRGIMFVILAYMNKNLIWFEHTSLESNNRTERRVSIGWTEAQLQMKTNMFTQGVNGWLLSQSRDDFMRQ